MKPTNKPAYKFIVSCVLASLGVGVLYFEKRYPSFDETISLPLVILAFCVQWDWAFPRYDPERTILPKSIQIIQLLIGLASGGCAFCIAYVTKIDFTSLYSYPPFLCSLWALLVLIFFKRLIFELRGKAPYVQPPVQLN